MIRRSVRRSQGIALLIVLVVLVLIATLATEIAVTAKTHHTISRHSMDDLLLRTAVDGRVEILKAALTYEASRGLGYDGENGTWSWKNQEKSHLSSWGERGASTFAQSSGDSEGGIPYKNSDVQIVAWCEDERSRINLRGLMKAEETDVFKHTRDTLVRLIDLYRDRWSALDLSEGDAREMVDDLVQWLQADSDTDDNPMPAVKPNRGRLQSIDDLLRVPGGRWTQERLYDVKDPDQAEDENGTTWSSSQSSAETTGAGENGAWDRLNGIAGLSRFITVFAETTTADPPMRVNINTASVTVLRALLESGEDELAQAIADHRRQGAEDTSGGTSGTSGTSGTQGASGTGSTEGTDSYFRSKADLSKVEGMDKDLAKYPRLNFFADTTSTVYSLRVIARVVRSSSGSMSTAEDDFADSDEPRQVDAVCDYRQVVQRTSAGFITILTERRTDPQFDSQ
jgi:type II secretory pathway component PulK